MSFLTRLAAWCLAFVALHAPATPVEITPPDFAAAVQPQVSVAPNGRIEIVFGKGNAIYHTASPDGRAFTPPVKVGELEKLALRMRRGPRIAATNSAIIITAISHADGDVHEWTSADRGATWKKAPRLNEIANSAREGLHAMAGDGRGLVVAAWLDVRGTGKELRGRVSHDAGATWGPEVRIYASPDGSICQCCHPSLAIGPKGEITAMWRNSLGGARDLWMATSRDGGKSFDTAQKIGPGTWKLNACPMDGGALAIDAAGHAASVWRREKTIFASTSLDVENKLADNAAQPVAAFAGNQLVIVWEESGGLKIRRGESAPSLLAPSAHAPSLAALPSGGVVVVWESTANGRPSLRSEIVAP